VREQKLIDICFQAVLLATNEEKGIWFKDKSVDEKAAWIRDQLKWCGFPTEPIGSSHGILQT